jgi:hypothetical protein
MVVNCFHGCVVVFLVVLQANLSSSGRCGPRGHWLVRLLYLFSIIHMIHSIHERPWIWKFEWPNHPNAHIWTLLGFLIGSTYSVYYIGKKIYFWQSNSCLGLILSIELQNWVSLTIQLLKPFTIGHRVVLMSDFNFFIYNLVLRS